MRFTLLIPTFDHGRVIQFAMDSVFRQTVTDWELFIVGDGSPEVTREIVEETCTRDPRIRFFPFPKGARHGEALRHEALGHATGQAVCYLCDDDFWFPDHLEVMRALLECADFVHTRQTFLLPNYHAAALPEGVADPATRERMLAAAWNPIGLSIAGHRLDAYRRLPLGWSPAPADVWTDLHMWRKWLAAEGMRFASSQQITSLHLGKKERQVYPTDFVGHETSFWYEMFLDPAMREALRGCLAAQDQAVSLTAVLRRARLPQVPVPSEYPLAGASAVVPADVETTRSGNQSGAPTSQGCSPERRE